MKTASTRLPDGHGSVYKEVRFSPTSTPLRRTKSVSGSTPSTSSKYQSAINLSTNISLDTSFIDQSRELLENQRFNFEAERKLFAQERQLWDKERSLLRTKIAELEILLRNLRSLTINSFSPQLGSLPYRGPSDTGLHSAQVWEGSSPGGRPTRVFRDEEKYPDNSHLSSVTEGNDRNPPSLDAALSPQALADDFSGASVSIPVPIEKLDSKLDGITLKSSALPPSVVARVITPPSPSPLDTPAPVASAPARPSMEHRNSLKLKLSELGPPNENLVRDAGHTPMAVIEADGSQRSTKEASPLPEPQGEDEAPLAPFSTGVDQPTEQAQSYFPDLPDDPALQGPLGLTNKEEHDDSFLSELDQKLLDQAKKIQLDSRESVDTSESDTDLPSQEEQEEEPGIKFKNSTNFGTAFGLSSLGRI